MRDIEFDPKTKKKAFKGRGVLDRYQNKLHFFIELVDEKPYPIPRDLVNLDGNYHLSENGAIYHEDTLIDDCVAFRGGQTIIRAGVSILGSTTIGRHCKIGENTVIENSKIGSNVKIGINTEVVDSIISSRAVIGNDVEICDREIGEGAKILDEVHLEFGRRIIPGEVVSDSLI